MNFCSISTHVFFDAPLPFEWAMFRAFCGRGCAVALVIGLGGFLALLTFDLFCCGPSKGANCEGFAGWGTGWKQLKVERGVRSGGGGIP